jgi:hypothetical protein
MLAVASLLLATGPSEAQSELSGTFRDAARAAIVYPAVFDPLLTMPLTPGPEGVVDVHGTDVAGTYHVAARNRDDSYGVMFSAPLSTTTPETSVDPRGLRRHASLGFHITNIIWHPKVPAGLEGSTSLDEVRSPWALFMHADYRYNRAEYEFADPQTLQRRTDTRLNDTASLLFGAQLFAKPRERDPGYFLGFSYTYSAVFQQFGGTASNGLPAEGPTKVRGNLLRLEVRRALGASRFGVNPSVTYENNSHVTTVDVTGYARLERPRADATNLHGPFVGARVGRGGEHNGGGGVFVTVFAGWEGWD